MNLPSPRPGKRPGQKYKSLLVLQYLLKNADDENAVTMSGVALDRCPPELQRGYTRKVPGTNITRVDERYHISTCHSEQT